MLTLRKYEQQLLRENLLRKTQYYHRKWNNWMETLFLFSNQDVGESAWVIDE